MDAVDFQNVILRLGINPWTNRVRNAVQNIWSKNQQKRKEISWLARIKNVVTRNFLRNHDVKFNPGPMKLPYQEIFS
jgi:hypothetical protein